MIFLFILAISAMAEEPREPEDKSAGIYRSYCVSCHGENVEKIPLNPESTAEQRIGAVSLGVSSMPPYNWMLGDEEVKRVIKFMEQLQANGRIEDPQAP